MTLLPSSSSLSLLLLLSLLLPPSFAALVREQPLTLRYHNGPLLKGTVTLHLIWYGNFTPIQRSIIADFIQSLSSPRPAPPRSAASWWRTTQYYKGGAATIILGKQLLHPAYTLGKNLKDYHLRALAAAKPLSDAAAAGNKLTVVLTAADVTVDGFCMSRCGTHGSIRGRTASAFAWVGNPETQCAGYCAWPFHQPLYGPQTPPLVSPNGDVGVDGMIVNLAAVIAGAVTNPFKNGYFQDGPMYEAVTACTGIFGKGAYPGYPGEVLVDKSSGASYNAVGVNGRKFLLPAMWDPRASACTVPV